MRLFDCCDVVGMWAEVGLWGMWVFIAKGEFSAGGVFQRSGNFVILLHASLFCIFKTFKSTVFR